MNAFVAHLAELPISEWLDVGRALATNRGHLTAHATAKAILNTTILDRGLGVTAWYVRDAVETAACLAGITGRRWSPVDRCLLADARDAAEGTILALLVRDDLTAKDFDVLCAPFSTHIVHRMTNAGTLRQQGATG